MAYNLKGKGTTGLMNQSARRHLVKAGRLQNSLVSDQPSTTAQFLQFKNNRWTPQSTHIASFYRGLTLSNNATDPVNDINISTGTGMLTIGDRILANLTSTLTKQLDQVWAAGNNLGGRFNGVSLTGGFYHIFLLRNASTGVVDAGFDNSPDASNRPSGWSARRIGCILWDGAAIVPFTQFGWYFEYKSPRVDLAGAYIPTTSTSFGLSLPNNIPVVVAGILTPGMPVENGQLSISVQSPAQEVQTPWSNYITSGFRGVAYSLYNRPYDDVYWLYHTIYLQIPTTNGNLQMLRSGNEYINASHYTNWQTLGFYDQSLLTGS